MGHQYQERWSDLYKAAVLETNWDKLEDRIKDAEEAIAKRASLDGEVSPDERAELEDARAGLGVLKQEHIYTAALRSTRRFDKHPSNF